MSDEMLTEGHPLAPLFGKYKDDPLWEGLERRLEESREAQSSFDLHCDERRARGYDIVAPSDMERVNR